MNWTAEHSRETYAIEHWGDGYFDINDSGRVVVFPNKDAKSGSVDLGGVIESAQQEGLSLPVLIRFTDILHHRIKILTEAFDNACTEYGYEGRYTPVYPIKVNQQRGVVEGIIRNGGRCGRQIRSHRQGGALLPPYRAQPDRRWRLSAEFC